MFVAKRSDGISAVLDTTMQPQIPYLGILLIKWFNFSHLIRNGNEQNKKLAGNPETAWTCDRCKLIEADFLWAFSLNTLNCFKRIDPVWPVELCVGVKAIRNRFNRNNACNWLSFYWYFWIPMQMSIVDFVFSNRTL